MGRYKPKCDDENLEITWNDEIPTEQERVNKTAPAGIVKCSGYDKVINSYFS
jgi:hypothetical protein